MYVLAPDGVFDNETHVSVRLQENMPSAAPAVLQNLTLCVWFKVIAFYKMNPIMSYAIASDPLALYLSKLKNKLSKVTA